MPGPYIQSWKKVSTIAKHIQTQSEWEQTMARRVMEQLRGELYLDQRYLTAALGALPAAPRESGGSFATDGGALYYPTAWLLDATAGTGGTCPGLPAQPVPLHLPASLAAGQARPRPVGACL